MLSPSHTNGSSLYSQCITAALSSGSRPLVPFSSPLGSDFRHGNITQSPFCVSMSVMYHHCQPAQSHHPSPSSLHPDIPSSLHAAGQPAPPRASQKP
ncbi:hypothetical protein PBY51_019539 [Eleginops maclovinus]|uniref:Uncharacterized protein n=1 Tax=Eleginops maclovinus TaxID=56733 RepID=A0AAN7YBA4_ELEMC|nr:hypothetical protein PBY51_019539 [Eleginops maclovinus]